MDIKLCVKFPCSYFVSLDPDSEESGDLLKESCVTGGRCNFYRKAEKVNKPFLTIEIKCPGKEIDTRKIKNTYDRRYFPKKTTWMKDRHDNQYGDFRCTFSGVRRCRTCMENNWHYTVMR